MALHLPFVFGTTPTPEVRRLWSGGSKRANDSACSDLRPKFSVYHIWMCVCRGSVLIFKGRVYPMDTPLSVPSSSQITQALSG